MASADPIVTHISHIDSIFHELEYLAHVSRSKGHNFQPLRLRLRNLKRFVQICAREGGSASLLAWIEETVRRYAENNYPKDMVLELESAIISMEERIDECYQTPGSSSSCSPDDVLESLSFISEAILDVKSTFGPPEFEILQVTTEALEEQLSFMKRLICYLASRLSVESYRELLSHSEYLAIHAACMLFTFRDWEEFTIFLFLQKMMPLYETCAQALSRSKLQGRVVRDGDDYDSALIAMKDFLDSLISNLWGLLRQGNWQSTFAQDLQELYGGLRSMRTALKKGVKMEEDIGDAVCDAGVFVCSLQTELDPGLLKNLLDTINTFLREIEVQEPQVPMLNFPGQEDRFFTSIKEEVLETSPEGSIQRFEVKKMETEGGSSSTLANEETQIVDQLTRGSKQLRIVAIVGMPGLGKTTLATEVYNNVSVSFHFHVRALCSVSHVVDKKRVLLDLLKQLGCIKCSKKSTEQDLADALRRSIKGRKYLIFLDDVWDLEAWTLLSGSFPDDNVGSRIMLTSRRHDVAPHDLMVNAEPYFLRQLNDEESFELLQSKLSSGLSLELQMKIAETCRGLPLIIVIVAGVLKHAEPENWDELLACLSNVSIMDQCRKTLEVSYNSLPVHLRQCLLYFGSFAENKEVPVRKLLRLWIAEGFIQSDARISLEDAAEDCLNDLTGRSLVMVAKQRSLGGMKACRIHDLIHDFCIQKAKDEHFFHFLRGYDELSAFNEPCDLQRLCIHSKVEHFKQSRLFCPRASSLILNSSESTQTFIEGLAQQHISSTFCIFKLLKVLDLEHVHFGCRFPSEIEQLVQLTFLAILSEVLDVPSWIGKLSNLETLIILGDAGGRLPLTLWNLHKLQYLYFGGNGYLLPTSRSDVERIALSELDRISGIVIPYRRMASLLRKFPNIRRLKCRIQYDRNDSNNLVFPNILSQIQSLTIPNVIYDGEFPHPTVRFDELSFPANLKKLMLGRCSLTWKNISTIGELPSLEVFKLLGTRFEGTTWEMRTGEFSKLKYLKLVCLKLSRWCADDDQFDCLQKLVLKDCSSLREMPSCLDSIPTLEVIEVLDCYYTVIDLVREVEGRRKDLIGDSGLKIIVNNVSPFSVSNLQGKAPGGRGTRMFKPVIAYRKQ